MWQRNKILFGCTIVAFILTGLLRDFIFVNWNYHVDASLHDREFNYAHSFFDFLLPWSYKTLYWCKWLLTALFCGINFGIAAFYFQNKKINKQLLKLYAIVGIFALGIYALSFLQFPKAYTLSREIIGFLQSPMPAILLFFIHNQRFIQAKTKV